DVTGYRAPSRPPPLGGGKNLVAPHVSACCTCQCVSNTAWYSARLACTACSSAGVGLSGSAAAGRLPNRNRQAMRSRRALVAVRLLPAMARWVRKGSPYLARALLLVTRGSLF